MKCENYQIFSSDDFGSSGYIIIDFPNDGPLKNQARKLIIALRINLIDIFSMKDSLEAKYIIFIFQASPVITKPYFIIVPVSFEFLKIGYL